MVGESLASNRRMKNYIPLRKYKHPFKETARRDPYRSTLKPKGQPICPSCRAVSIRGRWLSRRQLEHQKTPVEPTQEVKCPACRQKEDQFALGVIEIRGEAWRQNQEEILNTLKNTESIARNRNDQERILWVKELKTMVKVYVSLPELARQMGRELENSFQGFKQPRPIVLLIQIIKSLKYFSKYLNEMSIEEYV